MRKYFFPVHCGANNRGCEGILKGTLKVLKIQSSPVFALGNDTRDLNNDLLANYGNNVEVTYKHKYFGSSLFGRALGRIQSFIHKDPVKAFFKNADKGDVMFFTGGDLYCYKNCLKSNKDIHDEAIKKGCRTILWGCSLEKEVLDSEAIDDLKRYDLIVARESITFNFLQQMEFENALLFPDSAFSLNPEITKLPACFEHGKQIVGINISNFTNQGGFNTDTLFMDNIVKLISEIIASDDKEVLLIPHVFWADQDDRVLCDYLINRFKQSKKIHVLSSYNLNYLQIRYVISKCSFFIGSRTHSVISAYSCMVPCLALGYSVKSAGIAKDLNLDNKLVVDTKHLTTDHDVYDSYCYMVEHEQDIIKVYKNNLPQYIRRLDDVFGVINDYNN